ncbi:MAG: ABC transporter ATP-binding protein, partial [Achromobacter sp.]|nr:ABC transporter ATP-binding protein [Achromobacter sp.]
MLEVDGLKAGYGRQDVLHGLSLPALAAGQLTALLGPNGSGKSTLLKTLAGLVRARTGTARLDGRDLTAVDPAERARHIVYLPQGLPAEVHLRVFESVLVASRAGDGLAPSASPAEIEAL